MELKDRIKLLMERADVNATQLALKLGLRTKQAAYDLVSGKTKTLSPQMLEKFLQAFPEVNSDWLIFGKGEIVTPPSAPADARPHIPANLLEVMAGGLSDTDGVNLRDLEMHPRIDSFKDYDFTISVRGDSMFPYICEGDTLAVSAIEPSQLRPGEIYVLDVMGDGAVVKRVYDEPDAQRFRLISINPDYDPYHVSKSDVRALYLVVGILRSRF